MRFYREQKKVLVTGGCGFLGSHLVDKLIERGDYVIAVDNLFTGSRENTLQHESNPNFEFLRHDVEVNLSLEVDEIYNLACPASPVHYQHDPVKTVKTCVLGAINMLNLAKRLDAKIFQASTSEVYGDPAVHPQTEAYFGNVNPIGIRSCYDEGKRISETLFFDYHRKDNVDIRVARIFNTYGPRMHPNDGRVVSNFIVQALQGKDLTIYGDGSQTRSFCYVDDLIDGFLQFMDLTPNDDGVAVYPGPLNLGNPAEFTILELAHIIISMTGSSSNIIASSLPSDDPMQRMPDITLAKDYLAGWHPGVALEEGLKKTIEYFDDLLVKIG
jgi:UDP-glucuronate decarboxylase